jgi:hypothetical protein
MMRRMKGVLKDLKLMKKMRIQLVRKAEKDEQMRMKN